MPEGLIILKAGFTSTAGCFTSLSMIVLQTLTHESQMYTPGPAMIFFTSACDFPQKEHSVMRDDLAMAGESLDCAGALSRSETTDPGRSGRGLHHDGLRLPCRRNHMVHNAILLGLLGAQVVVAVGVLVHLLGRLARVPGDDLAQRLAPAQDLLRRD